MLTLIVAFVVIEFLFSGILSFINSSWRGKPIPVVLNGIYDDEAYVKQQRYGRENDRIATFENCLTFVITLALLLSGGFGYFDAWCKTLTPLPLLQLVAFMSILIVVMAALELPFSHYTTFRIEEKYGFNKTTHRTFWLDNVKSLLLSIFLTSLLTSVIYWLYSRFGSIFWIYALFVCTAFIILFNGIYSQVIVPLFNKQTPLGQGELRDKIEALAAKSHFSIKDVYVIDGSKHSTKANAYFSGWGKMKRVVLYDTLIEQLSTDEILAVLAHEIGHYKHHDLWKSMALTIIYLGINLCLFSLLAGNKALPEALGGSEPSFALALVAFSLLFTPISMIWDIFSNLFTRKHEYRADGFAKSAGLGDNLISGLKKLSANSFSNLTPHPFFVWCRYSHPTLEQRIKAINSADKSKI